MIPEEDGQQSLGSATPVGVQQKVTWVGCDTCGKWRKVSQAFAESLDDDKDWYSLVLHTQCITSTTIRHLMTALARSEAAHKTGKAFCCAHALTQVLTNCRFCELNPDPAYNSCDAPQELSDQEIDNLTSTVGSWLLLETSTLHVQDTTCHQNCQLSCDALQKSKRRAAKHEWNKIDHSACQKLDAKCTPLL